jgi:hypothetical protein
VDAADSDDTVGTLQPTQTSAKIRPRASSHAPSQPGSQSQSTSVGSPLEALERDEILRTRRFCGIGIAITLAGATAVPLLPGDPTASVVLLTAVGVAIASILFLYVRTFDPIAFRKPSTVISWYIPAACVTTAIPYFGVFSPAPLVLVLGIYFTGLGRSHRLAIAVYTTCAGAQLVLAALIVEGAARDPGVITAGALGHSEQWIVQMLVQAVLLGTYVTARVSRRTALLAVGELERAVRLAAHREALLLEAREELERALKTGRGRFSGQVIGRYELGALLGRGAMGEVYAATGPGGDAAVKLLSQASLGNPEHVKRFLRELRTAAQLDSPHVVHVIDVGEDPVPYLVMERLEGPTLAQQLRTQRTLPVDEVVRLVHEIGLGIGVAAAAGIVHRDLKPQNVILHRPGGSGAGAWKILDFGVARGIDHGDTLTSGRIVGTPSYMAPEQASGGTVDHRTDLYAIAAIAYRALTGHPPFAAGEIAETLYRVVHLAPKRPSELVVLPTEVDLVLAVGLAKLPSHRFATAGELALALGAATNGVIEPRLRAHAESLEERGAWARGRVGRRP